ncbi:MAG: hypothetical protein V3U88_01120 [Methylococcales bacterium]
MSVYRRNVARIAGDATEAETPKTDEKQVRWAHYLLRVAIRDE